MLTVPQIALSWLHLRFFSNMYLYARGGGALLDRCLSFFFWLSHCLSFFVLLILSTLCYLHTLLIRLRQKYFCQLIFLPPSSVLKHIYFLIKIVKQTSSSYWHPTDIFISALSIIFKAKSCTMSFQQKILHTEHWTVHVISMSMMSAALEL